MTDQNLGTKLKEYRERKFPGMSLRKAAANMPIHFVYLNRVEKGIFAPSRDLLDKLSDVYNLTEVEKKELYSLAGRLPEEIENMIIQDPEIREELYLRLRQKSDDED